MTDASQPLDKAHLADMWKFPWPLLDVLIGGNSSIDLPELRVHSWSEATAFLSSYGYDLAKPAICQKLHGVIVEAIAFIERVLITPREWARGVRPPREVLLCEDPRHLLIWASEPDPRQDKRRAWSCAVLRVMHTIGHIEGVHRYIPLHVARQQIMARFRKYIHRDPDRSLWFGSGSDRVRLERAEWKERKTRTSIILKLLHKKDNVAETIYDYLGVRLVTARLCDVMMVVKFLRQFHIVSYPNCYPSRARNNLIDTKRFRQQIETLRDMLTAGSISPEEFETMLARLTAPSAASQSSNPHSSQSYRSIQLTCRQLIEAPSEQFSWLNKVETALNSGTVPELSAAALSELRYLVGEWHAVRDHRVASSFFPFEIQVMDAEAYQQVISGEANHDRYKQSQVRAARKRVLGALIFNR